MQRRWSKNRDIPSMHCFSLRSIPNISHFLREQSPFHEMETFIMQLDEQILINFTGQILH